MSTTVKVLAVVGVVFLLLVGGCVGCAVMIYNAVSDMPAHHNRDAIQAQYPELLERVRSILAAQGPSGLAAAEQLPATLLAVFIEEPEDVGPTDYTPVHPAHAQVEKGGYLIFNGAGSVEVSLDGQRHKAVAYTLEVDGTTYLLALHDWQPEPVADAP